MICTVLMLLAAFGAAQAVAGLCAVRAFARTRSPAPAMPPPVTVLKPVCGDEPLLEEAIQSFCVQDYPRFQLLIGAQDAGDPALDVARRLQAKFPTCDIGIVIDPALHGPNRKVSNLMNMLAAAKHPPAGDLRQRHARAPGLPGKAMVRAAGLTAEQAARISGHSSRVGAAQDMAASDRIEMPAIMQAGGWKSPQMVARYTQRQAARRSGAAKLAELQNRT